mmetsp:Transcript_24100/g.37836  ORF Transcript_24100/g.37836 Transcript_24100/m.37836 type:complete len:101 (+) Transcript_24100:2443-2745(+)
MQADDVLLKESTFPLGEITPELSSAPKQIEIGTAPDKLRKGFQTSLLVMKPANETGASNVARGIFADILSRAVMLDSGSKELSPATISISKPTPGQMSMT